MEGCQEVFSIIPNFVANGKWHRGRCCGRLGKTPFSAIGNSYQMKNGHEAIYIYYQCYKCGIEGKWNNVDESQLSVRQKADWIKIKREQDRQIEAEKLALVKERRALCKERFNVAIAIGESSHPYYIAKNVTPTGHERIDYRGTLLIPFYDVAKNLISTESIWWNSENNDWVKSRFSGCTMEESFIYSKLSCGSADTVYIAEGASTARTIEMATERPCVAVGGCKRLLTVAQAIQKTLGKKIKIVICPDNDKNGAGAEEGKKILEKMPKVKVIMPQFKEQTEKDTDFNDLMQKEGVEAVKAQLVAVPEKKSCGIVLLSKNITTKKPIINKLTGKPYFVTPLGWVGDRISLVGYSGIEHKILVNQLGAKTLRAVCENYDFWFEIASRIDPYTEEEIPDWTKISEIIIERCNFVARNSKIERRGPGVYMDGRHKVLHMGHALEVNGILQDEYFIPENLKHFYEMKNHNFNILRPALNSDELKTLIKIMEDFPFKSKAHGLQFLALLGLAQIPALIEQRPAGWVNGTYGGGKTVLAKLIRKLVPFHMDGEDVSAAAIRAYAKESPLAIIADEMDPKDEVSKKKIDGLLGYMIRGYTKGAIAYRATPNQDCVGTTSNLIWIFLAINKMAVTEAAKSRIVCFDIDPTRRMEYVQYKEWEETTEQMIKNDFGAGFFKLVAQRLDLFKDNLKKIKPIIERLKKEGLVLKENEKHLTGRIRDNYAPLWSMMATIQGLEVDKELIKSYFPILLSDENMIEETAPGDMGMNILNDLLTMDLDHRFTVKTAIETILRNTTKEEYRSTEGPKLSPGVVTGDGLDAFDSLAKCNLCFTSTKQLIIPLNCKKLRKKLEAFGHYSYGAVLGASLETNRCKIKGIKVITLKRFDGNVVIRMRGFLTKYDPEEQLLLPENQ